jgi:uncharacterized membrane protein SpoIIM required for sporulation
MALILVAGMGVGIGFAQRYVIPAELISPGSLGQGSLQGAETIRFFQVGSVPVVWLHNLQTIVLATLLGLFSYSVLGIIILMLPLALVGYFTAVSAGAGISPFVFFLALVAPHGILEIPAILLAGAAILRIGATLAAPSHGRTIGEDWLKGLADWARVMVILVLPLLLGAAILEVLVTPRVALLVFGG